MCGTPLLHEVAIPSCADCKASWKCCAVVCKADSKRTVLKTKGWEANRIRGGCIADTESHGPSETTYQQSRLGGAFILDTYPVPVVMFTFSRRVMRSTSCLALS